MSEEDKQTSLVLARMVLVIAGISPTTTTTTTTTTTRVEEKGSLISTFASVSTLTDNRFFA